MPSKHLLLKWFISLLVFLSHIVFGRKEAACKSATSSISPNKHYYAPDDLHVETIAFSSCYVPERVTKTTFWDDVRMETKPDLWLWLGDNMYKDGTNMDAKRKAYNEARDEESYVSQVGNKYFYKLNND